MLDEYSKALKALGVSKINYKMIDLSKVKSKIADEFNENNEYSMLDFDTFKDDIKINFEMPDLSKVESKVAKDFN